MDTASLREFVVLVPVCVETETLVDAWQIFQQTTSDYVVVIDLHQMPLGLLRLRQLVRYFAIDRSEVSSQPSIGYLQHLIHATNAGAITSTFLEPLTPLPIDLPLDQLQPYLSEIGQRQWALVNASGEYVGLLDRLRLLQCLAIHSLPQLDAADPFPPLPPQPRCRSIRQPSSIL
ncbi:MAG: hypothetical protein HC769_13515 [Cyanobacteria bacterium CRU_2_1]|nr:hypothetical protein [Cyanobacteria bacterium CRU_2_1]